jgi:hypothetical protein
VHHLSAKILATVLLLACAAAGRAQMTMPSAPPAATGLPRLLITADLLNGLPRRSVTVSEEDGSSATYSGVDLGLILAKTERRTARRCAVRPLPTTRS